MTKTRLSFIDSCLRLQPTYLDAESVPVIPSTRPSYDDADTSGVSFFRTLVSNEVDLSNLTLPRSFFCRSDIVEANFENSDLSESTLCWNDFSDVNFSFADLRGADLRASDFARCDFRSADLRRADLRQSTFCDCLFDMALLDWAILTRDEGAKLALSSAQLAGIAWTDDPGPEPGGG